MAPTATAAETALSEQVRRALGFRYIARDLAPDENATCVSVWSIRELQDVYAHIGGGTTTARPVTRRFSDGTFDAIEVTLAADLPDIGNVSVVTDWCPAHELHGFDLPVIRAISN